MINKIQLYAERHTGSKWLTKMLEDSFGIKDPWYYNWKHWFPEWEKIKNSDTSDCLFIVLSRNPYDWIAAMKKSPHHARPYLKKRDIDTFINLEWECEWTKKDVPWISDEMDGTEMMHERNPDTGERFKNIMDLRNYKNREFLKLQNMVEHIHFIRYEDMLDNPLKVINDIVENNPIKIIQPTTPKASVSNNIELTPNTIQVINDNINWKLEEQLGYKKKIDN